MDSPTDSMCMWGKRSSPQKKVFYYIQVRNRLNYWNHWKNQDLLFYVIFLWSQFSNSVDTHKDKSLLTQSVLHKLVQVYLDFKM